MWIRGDNRGETRENWSGKRDSNPRPSAWKADALATELFPLRITTYNLASLDGPGRIIRLFKVWRGKDSNLRRLSRQIYSLLPLTAREPLRESRWSARLPGRAASVRIGAGEGTRTPNRLI